MVVTGPSPPVTTIEKGKLMSEIDEWELQLHRSWALRHPLDVIKVLTCPVKDHADEGEFWIAMLGWDIETFVRAAFYGVWDRSA